MSLLCYSVLFGQRQQKRKRKRGRASCSPTARPSNREHLQDTLFFEEESSPDGKSGGVDQPFSGQKRKDTLFLEEEYSPDGKSGGVDQPFSGQKRKQQEEEDESDSSEEGKSGFLSPRLSEEELDYLLWPSGHGYKPKFEVKVCWRRYCSLETDDESAEKEEPSRGGRKGYLVVMKENHKGDLSFEELAMKIVNDVFGISCPEDGPYLLNFVTPYEKTFECRLSEAEAELVRGHEDVQEVRVNYLKVKW